MSLDPSVRDGWYTFTARFEGRVEWPYLDVKGLATVGLGCLVEPESTFAALPWLFADGTVAKPAEVAYGWQALKALPPGRVAETYAPYTGLHLADEAVEQLALERLAADVALLEEYFGDLSRFPAPVQKVLCSMSWALGAGFPPHWPKFTAAIEAGDWTTAADECAISTVGNPGVAPRNSANRALLLSLVR